MATLEPPAAAERCARCGGPLVQRADDREETILQRMDVYTRETAPVLEHYRRAGLLREIDGTGSREDVFARVAAGLS
jgi:adenylate kinase